MDETTESDECKLDSVSHWDVDNISTISSAEVVVELMEISSDISGAALESILACVMY